MPDKVRDWMSSPAIVIHPDSAVSYTLTLMRRRHIHSVVVDLSTEGKPSYGIVTSTDIRDKIILGNRKPGETQVREIMTAPVVTARPEWTLVECSRMMQERNIHHLPVVDDQDVVIGMISATDIFIAAEEIGWGEV
jgi:CBS domain-containing protein